MKKLPAPLHHSLILNAQAPDGSVAWSIEYVVLRSSNGFVRRSEVNAILEKREPGTALLRRKVVRAQLPLPEGLDSPEGLALKPWGVGQIRWEASRFAGQVRALEGELSWDLSFEEGYPLDFAPLPGWLGHRTLRTQIPLKGSWNLGDLSWSSDESPRGAMASIHVRNDVGGIIPSVWFHSQFLTESSGGRLHCADGLQSRAIKGGLPVLPALTRISAFEELKGNPRFSLWRALRASMRQEPRGWSFRSDQARQELRGKIEVESKNWITLRCEDIRGSAFYRTSSRMADLDILTLESGKPQGHFRAPRSSWVEWTSLERPEFAEVR
jgi:hypothetical protein